MPSTKHLTNIYCSTLSGLILYHIGAKQFTIIFIGDNFWYTRLRVMYLKNSTCANYIAQVLFTTKIWDYLPHSLLC